MARPTNYNDLNNYPANPYIMAPKPANTTTPTPGSTPTPAPTAQSPAGAGGEGYWTGPQANAGAWAAQAFSPEFNQARQQMYGWFGNAMNNMPSLANMYQGYLQQSPLLEQTQYNQALARLKGQYGTAMQA